MYVERDSCQLYDVHTVDFSVVVCLLEQHVNKYMLGGAGLYMGAASERRDFDVHVHSVKCFGNIL